MYHKIWSAGNVGYLLSQATFVALVLGWVTVSVLLHVVGLCMILLLGYSIFEVKQHLLCYSTFEVKQHWSERRCADGFVETAVGHYFWYFFHLSCCCCYYHHC